MFAVHQVPTFSSPAVIRPRQDKICIFEKFSTCKNGDNCNFQHPTLVCDDQKNCNITLCNKRHPQVCLYDTIFKYCMNDGTCRYHHQNNDSDEFDDNKYRDLEEKYNSLLEDYHSMLRRIEALENEKKSSQNDEMQSSRSSMCTRSRSQGDVKRKLDNDVKENTSEKKNKTDKDTLVSDDNSMVTKMDEDVEEVIDKHNEVSYNVFYKNVENELQNIKTALGKEKKITVKNVQKIKGMLKNIGKDYKFGKRTENMKRRSQVFTNNFEKVYDKIEKTDNSKFRDVTSAEIKKLIFLCKSEQNICT